MLSGDFDFRHWDFLDEILVFIASINITIKFLSVDARRDSSSFLKMLAKGIGIFKSDLKSYVVDGLQRLNHRESPAFESTEPGGFD